MRKLYTSTGTDTGSDIVKCEATKENERMREKQSRTQRQITRPKLVQVAIALHDDNENHIHLPSSILTHSQWLLQKQAEQGQQYIFKMHAICIVTSVHPIYLQS